MMVIENKCSIRSFQILPLKIDHVGVKRKRAGSDFIYKYELYDEMFGFEDFVPFQLEIGSAF